MKKSKFSIVSCSESENAWIDAKIDEFNRKEFSFTGNQLEIPINYIIKEKNLIIAGIKSCFSSFCAKEKRHTSPQQYGIKHDG